MKLMMMIQSIVCRYQRWKMHLETWKSNRLDRHRFQRAADQRDKNTPTANTQQQKTITKVKIKTTKCQNCHIF